MSKKKKEKKRQIEKDNLYVIKNQLMATSKRLFSKGICIIFRM